MIGEKYNRLTIIGIAPSKNGVRVVCRCDCGTVKILRRSAVVTGGTKSCGCLRDDFNTQTKTKQPGIAAARSLYLDYSKGARKRSLVFDLTFDQFLEITSLPCAYCGIEPQSVIQPESVSTPYLYNGLDRLNNQTGYTYFNALPCCYRCNKAKNVMTIDEFIDWICRVSIYLNKDIQEL